MAKRVGDLLALGLFLLSIALFMVFLNFEGLIKLIGLSGSTILFLVEGIFLWQTWVK